MTNRMYQTPAVSADWAGSRETHMAVAVAIHAIASPDRTPEAIWEAPTSAECDHVAMAITDYVAQGDFEFDASGYQWGQETISIEDPTT